MNAPPSLRLLLAKQAFACFVDQGNLDLSKASIEGSFSLIGLEAAEGCFIRAAQQSEKPLLI